MQYIFSAFKGWGISFMVCQFLTLDSIEPECPSRTERGSTDLVSVSVPDNSFIRWRLLWKSVLEFSENLSPSGSPFKVSLIFSINTLEFELFFMWKRIVHYIYPKSTGFRLMWSEGKGLMAISVKWAMDYIITIKEHCLDYCDWCDQRLTGF
jgi:hypothetical protein